MGGSDPPNTSGIGCVVYAQYTANSDPYPHAHACETLLEMQASVIRREEAFRTGTQIPTKSLDKGLTSGP